MVAARHPGLAGTGGVASATEALSFLFYLLVIHLNSNSHRWLMATILDSAVPERIFKLLLEAGDRCQARPLRDKCSP